MSLAESFHRLTSPGETRPLYFCEIQEALYHIEQQTNVGWKGTSEGHLVHSSGLAQIQARPIS